ncbi:MAG: PAS domain S-box protein [Spirochaetes bacterium]|nr:MAG: PAS domain S-box protein [Spirochaetota bacterium]
MEHAKVLIVEDDKLIAAAVARILGAHGYEIAGTASSGKQALSLIERTRPDVILMDIFLEGGMDGIETTRAINEKHGTPVIFTTAYSDEETVRRVNEVESFGYLLKPFNENEIVINIRLALAKHRIESRLRESESRYRTLFHSSNDAIYIRDLDGNLLDFNRSLMDLLGYTREELLAVKAGTTYVRPEDRLLFQDLLAANGYVRDFETQLRRKDGSEFTCLVSASLLREEKGGPVLIQGILRDITEQREALRQIESAHAEIVYILNAITSILIGVSLKDVVTHWNPAAEAAFQCGAADVVGRRFGEIPIEWEWARIYEGIADCTSEERTVRLDDLSYTDARGDSRILGVSINPLKDGKGLLIGFIVTGADITERRVLEEQLAHAQKMESIGQLSAGIAHEINSPLQYISDNLSFLKDAFADYDVIARAYELHVMPRDNPAADTRADSVHEAARGIDRAFLAVEVPGAIGESITGVQRVVSIIKSMKEFSHPGSAKKVPTDINKTIESAITISRNEWKYVADVKTEFDPGLPAVPLFEGELNRAALNIIINAAHAIGDVARKDAGGKGTIGVATRLEGDWVEIRISDTGTGIPKEIQPRIFDPFFTTKDVGKGTGQGLAIAYAIVVKKHGGTLTFDTRPGEGTTFIIRLKVSDEILVLPETDFAAGEGI